MVPVQSLGAPYTIRFKNVTWKFLESFSWKENHYVQNLLGSILKSLLTAIDTTSFDFGVGHFELEFVLGKYKIY